MKNQESKKMYKKILGFKTYYSDEDNGFVTEMGKITVVHLGRPEDSVIEERIREIIREQEHGEDFDDNCPLCQEMRKQPHTITYFEPGWDEEENENFEAN